MGKPVQAKVQAKGLAAKKTPMREDSKTRELEKRLAEALAQRAEASEQQAATSEILHLISSSPSNLQAVFEAILSRAIALCAGNAAVLWRFDGSHLKVEAHKNTFAAGLAYLKEHPLVPGAYNPTPRAALERRIVHELDVFANPEYRPLVPRGTGGPQQSSTVIAVPLLRGDEIVGVITIWRFEKKPFTKSQVALLQTFADQAVIAIENARLFRELDDKSRQLEAASRHKSEFLANMSHELRTPLNAIIGFSEVLSERMFGEINPKQAEYIGDILQSGQHLLSLINDILDLSKIEAGRMELELSDFHLPSTIEHTVMLVRERAVRGGIALGRTIDERLGTIRADERKVKQVLLNLLSNALKFTSEGGQIDVRASVSDGLAEISVKDTGVGIAPEDQEAVFEEFRQVGTAYKKVEGTGLGLAISRKFIELHGGKIWVTSKVGSGSTFAFTLPLQ